MTTLTFTKMHGLGNDFMVIDGISQPFNPDRAPIAAWADRHTGIGFDQLLLIESPHRPDADFCYRIFNADGSEVEQCGNGARCFARFVYDKGLTRKQEIVVETAKGLIKPRLHPDGLVTVDMGKPRFLAQEIPFTPLAADDQQALTHVLRVGAQPVTVSCVNMGNPHAVLLVDDIDSAPVAELGLAIETHVQFPQRVNVGFMQISSPHHIRLRVFERGVGETQACGTGACAAVVAGIRLGLLADDQTPVRVDLAGGQLSIQWSQQPDASVMMTGPVQTVYEGVVTYHD
ncbi:diaminopimelate epimerase [Neisseriaceae bacterium ESL0693]|nr:diaminopimelate epimerase [Neisseriaceae bacterium ESL0693]